MINSKAEEELYMNDPSVELHLPLSRLYTIKYALTDRINWLTEFISFQMFYGSTSHITGQISDARELLEFINKKLEENESKCKGK